MNELKIFSALGAVIFVLLLGAMWRGLFGQEDPQAMMAEQIAPVSASVADLDGRLATAQAQFDEQLATLQGAMDSKLADLQESMDGKLAGVQAALDTLSAQAAEGLAEDDLAALRTRLEELAMQSGELSAMVASLGSAPAETPPADPEPEVSQAAAPAPEPAADEGEPGLMPGQTALFDEGSVRVFISRLDPGSESLRASINGERKTLRAGIGRTVAAASGHCRITLDGVSGNGALVSALCGDDLPAAEGISAGETAMLNEGSLRVFASRVTEDAARLSANGTDLVLDAGDRATVMVGEESCRLTLAQVDRGHAQVGADCTDAVWQSDELVAGEAAILGDGAARVFVSFVQPDGAARIAVNGLALSTARGGETREMADNCDLTVADVGRSAAQFNFACYN
ncbi:hypothetical protein [Dinoroseobacter sp. S375]|uniref:hypothetical protein n=1 Tax=Dinoroseobacter sp. S375 TaxID=3415136 RepID=UPI003C7BDA5F